jgi:hypothetical protein
MTTAANAAVVIGQTRGSNISGGYHQTWEFDGSTWAKTNVPPLPATQGVLAVTTLGSDLVLLLGGYDSARSRTFLNETLTFDGGTWSEATSSGPTPALQAATLVSLDGQMLLVGGETAGSGMAIPLADLWTFNGSGWSGVAVSNAPPARYAAGLAVLP